MFSTKAFLSFDKSNRISKFSRHGLSGSSGMGFGVSSSHSGFDDDSVASEVDRAFSGV
jgi:hypothetical protein